MNRYKNILYVVDGYQTQERAIARAVSLAKNNQANLTVLDVVPLMAGGIGMPPGGEVSTELMDWVVADRKKKIETLVAPHLSVGNISIDVLVGETKFIEVVRAVLRDGYDLVVKRAENPDLIERLFGSVDMHLLRKCPCPVWLVKGNEKHTYKNVVAAVDPEADNGESGDQGLSERVLRHAAAVAMADGAQLHVVHVWNAPEASFMGLWAERPELFEKDFTEGAGAQHRSMMDGLMERFRSQVGKEVYGHLTPKVHILQGDAEKEVPILAKEVKADMVVMGTVARTGIPGFIIGNTAEMIIDQLQCSLLALKPNGFETPVQLEQQ